MKLEEMTQTFRITHRFAVNMWKGVTCAKCGNVFDTSNKRRRKCATCRGYEGDGMLMLRGGDLVSGAYRLVRFVN